MKYVVVMGTALALAGACKKKDEPASAGSAGSAIVAAPADARVVAAPAVLAMVDVDAKEDPHLAAIFGAQMPLLPALSADGTLIATLDDVSERPMNPPPLELTISKFPARMKVEALPVLTDDEARAEDWQGPELAARGKAVVAKLQGFHSLNAVGLVQPDGTAKPTKIGDLTLAAESTDAGLALALTDARGKAIHRKQFETTTDTDSGNVCTYAPYVEGAFTDPAKPGALYIAVTFTGSDGCPVEVPEYVVWSTDPASTPVEEQLASLVEDQLATSTAFAADAIWISRNLATTDVKAIGAAADARASKVTIARSRDGKTAWASAIASAAATWRTSDVLVETPQGWRITAAAWTQPVANAKANQDAKAGTLAAQKLDGEAGDASLNAAFAKLATEGATSVAKDIVAIGSGPGERTVGATAFAKPWNAAWKGKTAIVSSIARLAPSGTTGWVAATVELQKTGYKIPFTVFAVFDKDASGAWTLVHIHFAV